MRVFVLMSLVAFVLSGCGSTPTRSDVNLPGAEGYELASVGLTLHQKHVAEGYPEEQELENQFSQILTTALREADLLVDASDEGVVALEVEIDYRRHFAGEDSPAPSDSVATPTFDYVYRFSRDGQVVDTLKQYDKTISQGFMNNLKTVATMGLGNSLEKEKKDLKKVAESMASELSGLVE